MVPVAVQEEAAPYRTMIEVIVKFLVTSTGRRTSTISNSATPTKVQSAMSPKEMDLTSQSGRGKSDILRESDLPVKGITSSGSHGFVTEKSEGLTQHHHQDADPPINDSRIDSQFQRGKPITKPITSNPLTYDFSSSHSHIGESMPPQPGSWRNDASKEPRVDPRKHSTHSSRKDEAKVVTVKQRASRALPISSGMTTSGLAAGFHAGTVKGLNSSGRKQCTVASKEFKPSGNEEATSDASTSWYGRHSHVTSTGKLAQLQMSL